MTYQRFVPGLPNAATLASLAEGEPKLCFLSDGASEKPIVNPEANAAILASLAEEEPKTEFLPSADVVLMWERIASQLNQAGNSRPDAERLTVPVLKGVLHNDPRLAPQQGEAATCFVCGGPGITGNALLPFLSAVRGRYHWIHGGECHEIHRRNQAEKVDACLRAAGITDA